MLPQQKAGILSDARPNEPRKSLRLITYRLSGIGNPDFDPTRESRACSHEPRTEALDKSLAGNCRRVRSIANEHLRIGLDIRNDPEPVLRELPGLIGFPRDRQVFVTRCRGDHSPTGRASLAPSAPGLDYPQPRATNDNLGRNPVRKRFPDVNRTSDWALAEPFAANPGVRRCEGFPESNKFGRPGFVLRALWACCDPPWTVWRNGCHRSERPVSNCCPGCWKLRRPTDHAWKPLGIDGQSNAESPLVAPAPCRDAPVFLAHGGKPPAPALRRCAPKRLPRREHRESPPGEIPCEKPVRLGPPGGRDSPRDCCSPCNY